MSPVNERLAFLAPLASELNAATDELNETIEQIEDQLEKMGLGVAVWMPDSIAEKEWARTDNMLGVEETADAWALGYDKVGGSWHIAVKQVLHRRGHAERDLAQPWEDTIDESSPTPLLKAPREVRMEAAVHLEGLLAALAQRAEKVLNGVRRARAVASK